MENKLTKEEVLHVAKLARIKIDEDEILKYQIELKKLLEEQTPIIYEKAKLYIRNNKLNK